MVQPAEMGERDHPASGERASLARHRRIGTECLMRPLLVVVADERAEEFPPLAVPVLLAIARATGVSIPADARTPRSLAARGPGSSAIQS